MTGAGSFRRWLGCPPTIVAQVSHGPAAWEPAQRFRDNHPHRCGPLENHARISPATPRPAPHETFLDLTVGKWKELTRRISR